MNLTIEKSEFLRVLAQPVAAADRRSTIPILSNVLLSASDEQLSVSGTDLELCVSCSGKAKVQRGGKVTLPAKRLLDYLRLLPESEVNLKVGENQWTTITCGRSKARIPGMSSESYPDLPVPPDAGMLKVSPENLRRLIRATEFAISAKESRFALQGALLEIGEDEIARMVATDGHRLSTIEATVDTEGLKPPSVIIPRRALGALKGIVGEDDVLVSVDDNHIFFSSGDIRIAARRVTGNFPDYRRVMPNGGHSKEITSKRADVESILKCVILFSDERSRAVRMTFRADEILVRASSTEIGESEEGIPATGNLEEEVTIGMNANYLLDTLGASDQESVTFMLRDANSAVMIQPGQDGGRHVIMPMRM